MSPLLFNSHILVLVIIIVLSALAFQAVDRAGLKSFALGWCLTLGLVGLLLFILIYSQAVHDWLSANDGLRRVFSGQRFQVGVIGFAVGTVELVSRYKDNPPRALVTVPAAIYIVLNVMACIGMLYVLRVVQPDWLYKSHTGREQSLYVVLAAGFGAVALFRSSLFKLKTAEGETSIGPAVVLDTLLAASDRAVDRVVATPRSTAIAEIMKDISFERARLALPAYCFALMQNVSQQEQKDFGDQVAQLGTSSMNDHVRSLNLGLALLNIVGDAVLTSAVDALRPYIRAEPAIEQGDCAKIGDLLQGVDFEKARIALPAYCLALMPAVPAEVQKSLAANLVTISEAPVPPRAKVLMLGVALVGIFGFPVTQLAVAQLGSDIGG